MVFTQADSVLNKIPAIWGGKVEKNIIHNMIHTIISPTDDQNASKANQKEAIGANIDQLIECVITASINQRPKACLRKLDYVDRLSTDRVMADM